MKIHKVLEMNYLPYAQSVILSRALPDARDGLKPVQRRIIYTMHDMALVPRGRYRKSAAITGTCLAKYHPHGDQSVYDALVRMSQDFSLRYPLVDGQGNFGTLDGDGAASARYTEAKMHVNAMHMLDQEALDVVPKSPNYDNTLSEPQTLPAMMPFVLLNGAMGIAVGMATNIPPHHACEVMDALISLLTGAPDEEVLAKVQGPDFPTGGVMFLDDATKKSLYDQGSATFEIRASYLWESPSRCIITQIPYGAVKSDVVQKFIDHWKSEPLAQNIFSKVQDESAEDIRVVFEIKKGVTQEIALAYLWKHSGFSTKFHANMTALFPSETGGMEPRRAGLLEYLRTFASYRLDLDEKVLRARHHKITDRAHLLRGLYKILQNRAQFYKDLEREDIMLKDALSRSPFDLDDTQIPFVLNQRIPALSKLDETKLLNDISELERQIQDIEALLADPKKMAKALIKRLKACIDPQDVRRTTIVQAPMKDLTTRIKRDLCTLEPSESVHVIVTKQGWVKSQKTVTDHTRVRDGDEILATLAVDTTDLIGFLMSSGTVYVRPVKDIPQTAGFGEALSRLITLQDGDRLVSVFTKHAAPDMLVITDQGHAVFLETLELLDKPTRSTGRGVFKDLGHITMIQETCADTLKKDKKAFWIGLTSENRVYTGKNIQLPTRHRQAKRLAHFTSTQESWESWGIYVIVHEGKTYFAKDFAKAGHVGQKLLSSLF